MKKFIVALAIAATAVGAFAALRGAGRTAVAILPPQSVSANATVTNAVVAVSGFRGMGEVVCMASSVAAANSNRTVTVTLFGCETSNGVYRAIGAGSYKGAAAGVFRVPFAGGDLPPYIRTTVGNTTAASIVSGVLLCN